MHLLVLMGGHFLVMKTLPGNAHAVGSLIDHLDWEEILRNNLW